MAVPVWVKGLVISIVALIVIVILWPAFGDFIRAMGDGIDQAGDSIREQLNWPGWGPPSTG